MKIPTYIYMTLITVCYVNHSSALPADTLKNTSRFTYHFQFTAIDQWHGVFKSPYEGPASLRSEPEQDMSVTSTLFLGAQLWKNANVYFNPEISGGQGFSGASGIAAFPNGEIYRVGNPTPEPYIARLYIFQYFPLPGTKYKLIADDENQVAENVPDKCFELIAGKYCLADFFDNNDYSHNPRTQFMNWALMDNGAWDYPANTRGYTWSLLAGFNDKDFSIRASAAMEPTYANGPVLDPTINKTIGTTLEVDQHFDIHGHPGVFGLLLYCNIDRGGNYEQAVTLKNDRIDTTLNVSTLTAYNGNEKYGFGISYNQELTKMLGIFTRIGWNDGHTASWAFTEIDRSFAVGISLDHPFLRKLNNTFGLAILIDGISPEDRDFLAAGGVDYIIGDGKLPHYATENILESYYCVQITHQLAISVDYQYVKNPAYNSDRGPVPYILSGRVHVTF